MFVSDLDTPLLRLSPYDVVTLRDACQGIHVCGGIGSGKTSGPGRMIFGALLRSGAGGMVTAVKPEAVEECKRDAVQHGRGKSLILFDENEGFNFLTYSLARYGIEGIGTITECLMHIVEAAKKVSPTASQRGGEPFWQDAMRQVLRYAIPPLFAANGSLSIPEIIRFINTAPMNLKEPTSPEWQARSFMYSVMDKATRQAVVPMSRMTGVECIRYWAEEFPAIPDKTRGNIVISLTTALDRFNHGRLRRAFCEQTTLVPELSFHGAVIVLAMPTLTWNEDGIIAQHLFKYMWQRAVLSRNGLDLKHRERPLFLYSDEAQETVNSYDAEFLSVCRGSKTCAVSLTQSLPNYYAKIGGDNPRDAALSLVGKFGTHVYCSNTCPETNEFAARMIGKVVKQRGNYSRGSSHNFSSGMSMGASETWGTSSNSGSSYSDSDMGGGSSSSSHGSGRSHGTGTNYGWNRGESAGTTQSSGYSESMEYLIEPGEFARVLKTGGKPNRNIVTGVWFQGGRRFKATGHNVLLAEFAQ
jgi:hypothetical protein